MNFVKVELVSWKEFIINHIFVCELKYNPITQTQMDGFLRGPLPEHLTWWSNLQGNIATSGDAAPWYSVTKYIYVAFIHSEYSGSFAPLIWNHCFPVLMGVDSSYPITRLKLLSS